ncbi:MAG: phosphate uptake regulator PhoU [Candidatus Micrarchaeota archaeon]
MNLPRKIQLTGRNTYIVSLPHEWVAKSGISKGDAAFLTENGDGTLTLSLKENKKELKSCTIDVSKDTHDVSMRNIVAAYVGGAGTIILRGKDMSTIAEEARRVLSGVEITDESADSLTLRVLAFEDIKIDGIIKRAYNVTHSMFALSVAAYSDEGPDVFTEMSRKEDDVDRLYLLLLRTTSIEGFTSRKEVFKLIAAKSIEKIGDHLLDICAVAGDEAPDPDVVRLLEKGSEMYSSAYRVLESNELDRGEYAQRRMEFKTQLEKAESALKKEKDAKTALSKKAMLERCRKILRYSEDMMESSTDMYFAALGSDSPAKEGAKVRA